MLVGGLPCRAQPAALFPVRFRCFSLRGGARPATVLAALGLKYRIESARHKTDGIQALIDVGKPHMRAQFVDLDSAEIFRPCAQDAPNREGRGSTSTVSSRSVNLKHFGS